MFENTNMIVLKVTRDCNFRCKYCYVKNKDDFKGESMEFDVFKRLIRKVIEDRHSVYNNDKITIVFHGGEPLIVGKDKLSLFLSHAKRELTNNNIPHDFSFQTNASLLDDEMLTILHNFNCTVGISFDGVKGSNSARTLIEDDFFSTVISKLKKFQIKYGILMVVTPINVDNIIDNMRYVKNEFGVKDIKINYAEDVLSVGGCEITGKEFFEKVSKKILEELINKTLSIEENNINFILNNYFVSQFTGVNISEKSKSSCGLKICGGGGSVIEVNPLGKVHFCGRYSEDFPEALIGEVGEDDFLSMHYIKRIFDQIKIKHDIIKKLGCDVCIADDICDHGCPAFYYSKFKKWGIREDLSCELYKILKTYIVMNEEKIFESLYDYGKNRDGIYYLYLNTPVDEKILSRIRSKIGQNYTVEIDSDFREEEGKIPQVSIKRKEAQNI